MTRPKRDYRHDTTSAEAVTMIAQFDEVSGQWRVVGHDGTVIKDDFDGDKAACR
jgi:hypothetical protein